MALLQTLGTYLVIFAILVFFHELGHFLIAKAFRMRVEEFAFGFGPRVVRVANDGETDYTIRAIPLGGFVRIAGMEVEDAMEARLTGAGHNTSDKNDNGFETTNAHALEQESAEVSGAVKDGFNDRPVYQRFGVILAGPVFSFLVGWIALCLIGVTYGLPSRSLFGVVSVLDGKPAMRAGIKSGDILTGVNDNANADFLAVFSAIKASPGKPVRLLVKGKNDVIRPVTVTPDAATDEITGAKIGRIGVAPGEYPVDLRRVSIARSFDEGTQMVGRWFSTLGELVKRKQLGDSVGGPIKMVQAVGDANKQGGPAPLSLLGQFSLSLGLFNLFPIPVLDGGHLVLLTLEAVRRRKLTRVQTERVLATGLAVLAAFFLFVMFKDVRGLLGR